MDKSRKARLARLTVGLSRMSWGLGVGTLPACAFFVFALLAVNAMSQVRDTEAGCGEPQSQNGNGRGK